MFAIKTTDKPANRATHPATFSLPPSLKHSFSAPFLPHSLLQGQFLVSRTGFAGALQDAKALSEVAEKGQAAQALEIGNPDPSTMYKDGVKDYYNRSDVTEEL